MTGRAKVALICAVLAAFPPAAWCFLSWSPAGQAAFTGELLVLVTLWSCAWVHSKERSERRRP